MANKTTVDEARFKELKDKVVVLTGGANGIGASTVRYLVHAGALVVFGDFDKQAGDKLVQSFSSTVSTPPPTFVAIDVSKYEDNIKLFRTSIEKFGRVDHAIACAGIAERGTWFDPGLTIETVEKPETEQVIDVNLRGTLYFARIALVYLRHDVKPGEDKSLTLISSAAGFRDEPGLSPTLYQCSKHGVLGLLRTLRKVIYERDHIRINAICPSITDSPMTTDIIHIFKQMGQSINTCDDVAKYIVGLEIASDMNGKAIYVEGGRGWEVIDGLDASIPVWCGEEPTQRLKEYLEHVGQGDGGKVE